MPQNVMCCFFKTTHNLLPYSCIKFKIHLPNEILTAYLIASSLNSIDLVDGSEILVDYIASYLVTTN